MGSRFKSFGLIFVGVLAGVLLSLNFSAVAQRDAATRAAAADRFAVQVRLTPRLRCMPTPTRPADSAAAGTHQGRRVV